MRIVSVLPSATEIVHAVGAGADLVGRSEECDYPPSVRSLPVVMRARTLDSDRPSAEIDRRVQGALSTGESLYEIDLGTLSRLRPDLLITQDLCRVCSVTDEEARTACATAGVAPELLSLSPGTLAEVWRSIEQVGEKVHRTAEGRSLASACRARTPRGHDEGGPSVLVLEWLDPPIVAGLWVPELIRSAGGRRWGDANGAGAHRLRWEEIAEDPPDLLIVSPCSFAVPRTLREIDGTPLGRQLASVRSPRGIWVADEAHFSRPGPRLCDGRELIERLIQGTSDPGPIPSVRWGPPVGTVSG